MTQVMPFAPVVRPSVLVLGYDIVGYLTGDESPWRVRKSPAWARAGTLERAHGEGSAA